MTEISTLIKNHLCPENSLGYSQGENSLSEDDQRFYSFLKDGLDQLSKAPRNCAIENILNYSKSL